VRDSEPAGTVAAEAVRIVGPPLPPAEPAPEVASKPADALEESEVRK
jgi:hypothetical protein